MASSNSIAPGAREAANLAMRQIAYDITETIARSRDVIQQAREAMARVNLISEAEADHTPKGSRA